MLNLSTGTVLTLSRADMALGRLAGAGRLLPNPRLLLTPYIQREAVSSYHIEGTQTLLSEVLSAEADGDLRSEDVREVRDYAAALELGLAQLEALPNSSSRRGATSHRWCRGVALRALGDPSHEKGQLAGIQWRATVGPSGPAGSGRSSMSDNKATMLRLYDEVFSQGDFDLGDELLADDFVEHEEAPPGIPPGKAAPRTLMTMMRAAFPDFHAAAEELLEDGDKVIARARFSGTHQGEFMGIPATGKRFDIAVIDIIEFRDGKAIAHWGVMDMAGMMEQLGVGGPPA